MPTIGTPPPSEVAFPVDTVQTLLTNALVDAGIAGIDEEIEQPVINRALRQANWLIAQWSRKRWLVYRIQDYSFVSTGALSYTVGAGQTIVTADCAGGVRWKQVHRISGQANADIFRKQPDRRSATIRIIIERGSATVFTKRSPSLTSTIRPGA